LFAFAVFFFGLPDGPGEPLDVMGGGAGGGVVTSVEGHPFSGTRLVQVDVQLLEVFAEPDGGHRLGLAGLVDEGFEMLVGQRGYASRFGAVAGGHGALPPGHGVRTHGLGGGPIGSLPPAAMLKASRYPATIAARPSGSTYRQMVP
jgi:hypothetical protein